jgi:hypothetical protein
MPNHDALRRWRLLRGRFRSIDLQSPRHWYPPDSEHYHKTLSLARSLHQEKPLAKAVAALSHLPLRSVDDVEAYTPNHRQPIRAIAHVKVVQGWSSLPAEANT